MSAEQRQFIEVMISLAPWLAFAVAIIWSELSDLGERRRRAEEPAPELSAARRPSNSTPRLHGREQPNA
jgi:hypothetical protein